MEWLLKAFGDIKVATVVVVIAALFFLWKVYGIIAEGFRKKYQMQTEKEKQMHDILAQVEQYPKWRQQSIDCQNRFAKEIGELREIQQSVLKKLDEIEERRKKTKRNELRGILLQSFRYYTSHDKNPEQAWSEMEADAFWKVFGDYEMAEGDGHMHTVVQPAMRALEEIPMHEAERIANLMSSRK